MIHRHRIILHFMHGSFRLRLGYRLCHCFPPFLRGLSVLDFSRRSQRRLCVIFVRLTRLNSFLSCSSRVSLHFHSSGPSLCSISHVRWSLHG
jgi:hypothetical protein